LNYLLQSWFGLARVWYNEVAYSLRGLRITVRSAEIARGSSEYVELIADVFVETVRRAMAGAMCCESEHEEITPALMQCLQHVYLHGSSPVREIAAGLEISLSAVSQLVDRLVKRGLATRRENEEDRRLIEVDITDAGQELVRGMRERRSKWFESVVGSMDEESRSALLEGMERFLRIALAHEKNIDHACAKCGIQHAPFCVINEVKAERNHSERGGHTEDEET
jgi:DNA-binding MarR family transcriptional regulator